MLRIALAITLAVALALVLACGAGLQAAWAQSRAESPAVELGWRSSAGNDRVVARDIERLYLALYNTGNLAVRRVENADGVFVERLMRHEGVFHGTYFPHGVDNLVCDLNETLCWRERTPVADSDLAGVTGHVGGYAFSESRWTFSPGASITMPDYEFDVFATLRKSSVPADWSASDYRPDDTVDCSAWGAGCDGLVRSLNPKLLKAPATGQATAVLPVNGVETRFQLKPDHLTRHTETLAGIGARQPREAVEFAAPDLLDFSSAWLGVLARTSTTDLLIAAIENNLMTVGRGTAYSVSSEPLFQQQVDLFKLLRHPFGTRDDIDKVYKNRVDVLLLDRSFTASHCDFPPADEAVQPVAQPGPCDQIEPSPHPRDDHAAHIYGLISAPLNGRGMVGLNPSAHVIVREVNTDFADTQDISAANLHLISASVDSAGEPSVRVANLSWGFDRQFGGNILEAGIEGLEKTVLIVAAAGNENRRLTDDCRIFPACMYAHDNVITVVGLDRNENDPRLWSTNASIGSNSSRFFHIGAIAEGVLGTVRKNKLGHLSGTSQAAPQVTAAASLIYSAAEHIYADRLVDNGERLAPKIVKDRLIYTADLFPRLQPSVLSGRLNVERAIDIVDTKLVLKREGQIKTLEGTLMRAPNDIVTCRVPGAADVAHNWASIRRIAWAPDRKRFVIFKHEAPNDLLSKLVRVDGCNISSRSHVGTILIDDVEETFTIGEILDYTSPMLPE